MKQLVSPLFAMIAAQLLAGVAVADRSEARIENSWLMLVKTTSTDPAKETQFNEWYDNIDIPDVLDVPGYMRARRGLRVADVESPASDSHNDDGRYVALYDIKSQDIDKTIIDMLMATRKMEMAGRSTDLLKVTERVYYRQYAPAYEAPNAKPSGSNEYLLLERVVCCRDQAAEERFNDWYDNTHIPGLGQAKGFIRATRYELYRVLMVEPKQVPTFLTVYEMKSESAGQAVKAVREAAEKLQEAGRMSKLFVAGGSVMYLKIKDVRNR